MSSQVSSPRDAVAVRGATPRLTPRTLAVAAALVALAPAWAADVAVVPASPDAGAVLRDLPAAKPDMPKLTGESPVDRSAATPKPSVDTHFTFKKLALKGATSLSEEQVAQLGAAYANRPMGEAELAALLQALRAKLDDAGLTLAGIGLPAIDLAQGVVTIPVVEPRLGRVTVSQGPEGPVTEARVHGLMSWFHLSEGSLLNIDALERVMFALNDMPGVQAKAKLTPAGDEGVYNLTILPTARRSWDASVSLDNMGLEPVGRLRLGATARLNNPLGMGDNLDVQGLLSDSLGVKLGRVGYELPVGYTPARLALAASRLNYKLGGSAKDLGASGSANLVETSVSYPVLRSRSRTLLARVGLDAKHFQDHLDVLSGYDGDRRLRGFTGSLSWESRDAWGGGGFWGAGGTLRLGELSYASTVIDRPVAAGSYRKLEAQVSRLQSLSNPLSLFVAASVQQASTTLDPAEKVGLGGARGVRAYAVAEAPADDARIVNVELRWWLHPDWTVFALTDWAHGRLDHDTGDTSRRSVTLRGSGFGVVATLPAGINVRATLAWRHSGAGAADPGHDKPRLAFAAQHSF